MSARPWLFASLGLNVFLAVSWWVAREPLEDNAIVPPAPYRPALDLKTNTVVRRENFTWDMIESTNYATLIANLRALGCPEQTVRDIVITDINRIYDRRRALEVVAPDYQWWKSQPDPAVVQAAQTQARSVENERRLLLTSLLGPGWETVNNYQAAARAGISLTGPVLGDIPEPEKEVLLAVIARQQVQIEAYVDARRAAGEAPDPMEMARLRNLLLSQLVVALTPDQYGELVLRYSPGAQRLRQDLRGFSLEPDQFRSLYNTLAQVISQPAFFYAGNDPAMLKQQQTLLNEEQAGLKSALGDTFYTAYQINQDPIYQSSRTIAAEVGVPASQLGQIYKINRATEAEMDRIRNDPNMSADDKVEALAQTQMDQQQSLQELLGPDLFDKWIQAAK